MSFFTPLFLWLLPLTAIPIIIHLLSQRNIITIDFSSLRFFKMIEKESIRKIQLLQILLLILRTVIIFFIILMITRPVLTDSFNFQHTSESSLHAVIFDDSFSMRGNSNLLKNKTELIINQIPEKSQLIWININKGVQFNGLKEDLPPLDNLLTYTYLAGNLNDGLYGLLHKIEKEYTSIEVYILTDGQTKSMEDFWKHSDLFAKMHLYILISPRLENNLSINHVAISSETLLPNKQIEIEVSLKNSGKNDQTNVLLKLIINNLSVGQQMVSLISGDASHTFIFKTTLTNYGMHHGVVELNADNRTEDNQFFFNLNIPKQRNIAIISPSQEETYYILASLGVLNKDGEALSISEHYSLKDPGLKMMEKDVIFIISPAGMKTEGDSKIEEYLYRGGHLIFISNMQGITSEYAIINNLTPDIHENYNSVHLNESMANTYQEINLSSIQMGDIYNIFYSSSEQERNIRLFKYFSLPYNPEYSQLRLKDGSSIWNRYNIHSGIIDILGFSMNLNWTNFPIKGTFLPFIHFLVYSQSGSQKEIYQDVGNRWNITPTEYYSNNKIYHIAPDGSKDIINSDENNQLITDILRHPGFHKIQQGGENISQFAVNIAENELSTFYAPIFDLQNKASENMKIIPMNNDILAEIKRAQIGIELWRYILYFVIFLIMIEMILSNVQKKY